MGAGNVGHALGLQETPDLIDPPARCQVHHFQRIVLEGSDEQPPVREVHGEVVDPALDSVKRYRLDPSQRRGLLCLIISASDEHARYQQHQAQQPRPGAHTECTTEELYDHLPTKPSLSVVAPWGKPTRVCSAGVPRECVPRECVPQEALFTQVDGDKVAGTLP